MGGLITRRLSLIGPLEPTDEAQALAKIADIVRAQPCRRRYGASYISATPTDPYGPGDNFDLEASYVQPALIRRTRPVRELRCVARAGALSGHVRRIASTPSGMNQSWSTGGVPRLSPMARAA